PPAKSILCPTFGCLRSREVQGGELATGAMQMSSCTAIHALGKILFEVKKMANQGYANCRLSLPHRYEGRRRARRRTAVKKGMRFRRKKRPKRQSPICGKKNFGAYFQPTMLKSIAIKMLGATTDEAGRRVGCSGAAIRKWPDELPPRLVDRVIAAAVRAQFERTTVSALTGRITLPPELFAYLWHETLMARAE